ncbi:hypothetical protein MLD38_017618 [Melastoma candidum]|uniref:Uncharacterized protein n=1 Tax=Melastoma candidum TaxID=119954 RepID=A0ACB9QR71_9MYRT|nr:hypothetical protein MLD38_017618 [Melastoma candidum]
MARTNLRIRYIEDRAARNASINKRLQDLLRKVEELSILCDVQACVVFCGEDRDEAPVHWPNDRSEVEQVLGRYLACPKEERLELTADVGNVGDFSGLGLNTGQVGNNDASMGRLQGNTGASSPAPMIRSGGNDYNVEAPAENVPRACTKSIGPASMISDVEGPNQGGRSVAPE